MILRDLRAFLSRPPSTVGALLLYGPDRGKIRDGVDVVTRHFLGPEGTDRSTLDGGVLRADPDTLVEEAAKTSLWSEKRVIFIDECTDGSSQAWRRVIEQPAFPYPHSFVLAAAGPLKPTSSLRRLFEKTPSLACLACYVADERQAREGWRDFCRRAGYRITPEALTTATALFSQDSALNRREMEKLLLYAGSDSTIDVEDVLACLADNDQSSLEGIVFSVGEGDIDQLDRRLSKALASGVSPIAVLRVGIIHFLRLFQAAGHCAGGQGKDAALAGLRPPVFVRRRPSFRRQLDLWSADEAIMAARRLLQGESAAKREGLAEAECRRCLFFLARRARSRGESRADQAVS